MSFQLKIKKIFLNKIWYYIFTQISIFISDVYSVTTNANKSFLKKNFIFNNEKILIMPNWVTTNIERKEIINRKNEIITVGRLEKQKNFKYLIEEFSNTIIK